MEPELYERKKKRALELLAEAQDMGEGITKGLFRNRLDLNKEEFLDFIETMKNYEDPPLLDALPPNKNRRGAGRRSVVFHCPWILKGPPIDDIVALSRDEAPRPDINQPNPFYVLDKQERGTGDAIAALGQDAVFAIVDQMFKMGKKSFTKDELTKQMSVRVPIHLIDFVWNRFTIKLFEETKMNGGFDTIYEDDKQKLKRRTLERKGDELTSYQSAVNEAFTHRLYQKSESRYMKIKAEPLTNEEMQPHLERFTEDILKGGSTFKAVIDHPKLKRMGGRPLERKQRAEDDADGRKPDSPYFAIWDLIRRLPDGYYKNLLLELEDYHRGLEDAIEMYEESIGIKNKEE